MEEDKVSFWFVVLVAAFLVVAFASNPGYEGFERKIRVEVKQELGVSGGFTGVVVDGALNVIDLHNFIKCHDLKFFSLYTVQFPGQGNKNYIGAFGSIAQVYLSDGKKLVD